MWRESPFVAALGVFSNRLQHMAFRTLLVVALGFVTGVSVAQTSPLPFHSVEVHEDGTVTLRYRAPNAHVVSVAADTIEPIEMIQDGEGVWSATTPVLPPEIYNYHFLVDGVAAPDPTNPEVHPGFGNVESLFTVPGARPMPWELTSVPHGELTRHRFTSQVVKNLRAGQDEYVVYTPPGFDAKKKGGYPVLYLLHGYGDDQDAWTQVGRADLVLDNMIAAGKCVPMIVVMPLGYGNYDFLTGGYSRWDDEAAVDENTGLFEQSLESEVMPAVEHEYPIAKARAAHAVAGLSMGGLGSLTVALHHPEQFAYVAGMSSALFHENFDTHFSPGSVTKPEFKLLWVGVGVDDRLLAPNRNFVLWARRKGFVVTAVETVGAHQWPVWRENLVTVLPLLFR